MWFFFNLHFLNTCCLRVLFAYPLAQWGRLNTNVHRFKSTSQRFCLYLVKKNCVRFYCHFIFTVGERKIVYKDFAMPYIVSVYSSISLLWRACKICIEFCSLLTINLKGTVITFRTLICNNFWNSLFKF